jgi:hypothetical protein
MATNNKINISELDFDNIKANLKEFLKGQSEFSDYDFEGSSLNVLLDILAYNTHYNAMYTNLAYNEMFLDSASKRDSVVSIANNYGYLPTSKKSSRARINISFPVGTNTQSSISLPKGSVFVGQANSTEYNFYTTSEYISTRIGSNYVFENVDIYEGKFVAERFTVFENSKYTLANNNIDTSTIKVTIQDISESLNSFTYKFSETVIGLTPLSEVYFLKEIEDQKYELFFGKNNLGKEPGVGSVITVEYLTTNAADANGMRLFTYDGVITGTPVITLVEIANGGRAEESNDEIKYNVSRRFKNQNRAVTSDDYIEIIRSNYADIDTISCWGGQSMSPPVYGKVYISIKPKSSLFLTPPEKSYIIESILKPRSVLGITPELVDPTYVTAQIDTTIYYNPNVTNKTASQLSDLVRQTILDYNDVYLQKFDGVLRYSRLIRDVDDSDQAIISNITTVTLRRNINIAFNIAAKYKIAMHNPIYKSDVAEEAVLTNGFYIDDSNVPYYIDDDGLGKLRMFSLSSNFEKVFKSTNVGSVNYTTGEVIINSLFVTGLVESDLVLIIKPQSNDVISFQNQIVNIDNTYLSVNALQESSLATRVFTSSRT